MRSRGVRGKRPDLASEVTVPDVLFQGHSAPLSIAFYNDDAFPAEYRGNAFVALHGSWNRSGRTGYKVVMLPFKDGKPTGEYQDFMTGFVVSDNESLGPARWHCSRQGWFAAGQRRWQWHDLAGYLQS